VLMLAVLNYHHLVFFVKKKKSLPTSLLTRNQKQTEINRALQH